MVYESTLLGGPTFCGGQVVNDLEEFKDMCGCIIANRIRDDVAGTEDRVCARALLRRD